MCKSVREAQLSTYFQRQSDKFKRYMLGIQAHLGDNIDNGCIDLDQLWFSNYLKPKKTENKNDTTQVTVFLRVTRKTEALRPRVINSKMNEYRQEDGKRATHLVTEVVYGAELICSMQKSIVCELDNRECAEESFYLAVKAFFDETLRWKSSTTRCEPPAELHNVSCRIYSNLDTSQLKSTESFERFHAWLNKNIIEVEDDNSEKWRPIEMNLQRIPDLIEARFLLERMQDIKLGRKRNKITWNKIKTRNNKIGNHKLINRIPPIKRILNQLYVLLNPLEQKIEEIYTKLIDHNCKSDEVYQRIKTITDLLDHINDWLICRQSELEMITTLLKGTQLDMFDMIEIENRKPSGNETRAEIFVLIVDYRQDQLMEEIQKMICTSEPVSYQLAVFPIFSSGNERLANVSKALRKFSDKAIQKLNGPSHDSYQIGLVPVSSRKLNDGDIQIIELIEQDIIGPQFDENTSTSKTHVTKNEVVENVSENVVAIDVDQMSEKDKMTKRKSISDIEKLDALFAQPDETEQSNKSEYRELECRDVSQEKGTELDWKKSQLKSEFELLLNSNQRIACIFANEKFSQVKGEGKPSVYLLNAQPRENLAGTDLQWFDIGLPQTELSNHKIIILMGATGCGKSTLINGMVNYILDVKWNDPFRFKCVQEDVIRNQAHSQTSFVTAYTIHHHEGMTVPYSITIIDTPGYGDTRGVARDKEITNRIHELFTRKDSLVDQIHAVCFVAASGNNRLTTTQRYIIDSVLSIFGKDIKENIRLLVTFADNAVPPVVEACRAAHFPLTSQSVGILYNKFNSSVLYTSNKMEDARTRFFDELIWDMGQDSFRNFFKMLEGMKGRDLSTTREVIHNRRLIIYALKKVEQEIEVCLAKIENLETFRREMVKCGYKMEMTKNFEVKKSVPKYVKKACPLGKSAYNCLRCKKTCDSVEFYDIGFIGDIFGIKEKEHCQHLACPCPGSDHEYQTFRWRLTTETVILTLHDMKAEYQLHFKEKMTNEQLTTKCTIDLMETKKKVIKLLNQVGASVRSLESTALRPNALGPADYLALMRTRVAEEQASNYILRLGTLDELQNILAENNSRP